MAGGSRFLNKIYATDLELSGSLTTAGLTVNGDLAVTGATNLRAGSATLPSLSIDSKGALYGYGGWLRINEEKKFASGVYFGTNLVRTDGSIQLGNAGAYINMTTTGATFKVPINMNGTSYKWTTDGNIVVNGLTASTATIATASITNGEVQDFHVNGTLKTFKHEVQHIANLGGNFLVTPSFTYSQPTAQVKKVTGQSTYNLEISLTDADTIKSTIGGIAWTNNSKIKAAGKINNIDIGTCDGVISSINIDSNAMVIRILVDDDVDLTDISTTATDYSVTDLTVMITMVSGTNPIGIFLTADDPNSWPTADSRGKSSISIYGGTAPGTGMSATTPVVRIGYLTGLPAVNNRTPSGWGIYTNNGYFDGVIVSQYGKIGGWNIGTNALYSNSQNFYTSGNMYFGTSGISFSDTFKVTPAGAMTCTSGEIGGYKIDADSLYTGTKTTLASGSTPGNFMLSNGFFTRTIDGTSRSKLQMALGNKFGVTYEGTLYANGAGITNISASNIKTGTLAAARIAAGTLELGKLTTAAQETISDAAKTATNFLKFEPANGLMIANQSGEVQDITSVTGRNILIDYDSLDIRNGQTVVASFGENTRIGQQNKTRFEVSPYNMQFYDDTNTCIFKVASGDVICYFEDTEAVFHPQGEVSKITLPNNAEAYSVEIADDELSKDLWYQEGNVLYFVPPINTTSSIVYHYQIEEKNSDVYDTAKVIIGDESKAHSVLDENGQRFYAVDGTTQLANIGYGEGNAASGTVVSPYYTFGTRRTTATEYSSSSTYKVGDLCVYNGKLYVCRNAISTPKAWDSTDWRLSIGAYSLAEGNNTIASGSYSHAEGSGTIASVGNSHAEGQYTTASGANSHAEGNSTTASGNSSHAEGNGTTASGMFSHAEGNNTIAIGSQSHAQNFYTVATENYQTVIGKCNAVDTISGSGTTADPYVYTGAGNYAFIIGNGTANNTIGRSNALTVDWEGEIALDLAVDYSASSSTAATSGTDKDLFNAIRTLGWYSAVIS